MQGRPMRRVLRAIWSMVSSGGSLMRVVAWERDLRRRSWMRYSRRRQEGQDEAGVAGEEEGDVEEDPVGVGELEGLVAGTEGGDQGEEDDDGEDEDAEGDGLVAPVDEEEGQG